MMLKSHHTDGTTSQSTTLDSPGLLLVHHKRKNGGKGVRGEDWIQWLKWAYTPLNSHRLVGDSRLKQKQNNQGYLGNTSLEVPSVLEKVWSTCRQMLHPELLSKQSHHVVTRFPTFFLCWVQFGKRDTLSSLVSCPQTFPFFRIWPELLTAEQFLSENTHSWFGLPQLCLTHEPEQRQPKRKNIPGSESTLRPFALQKVMGAKSIRGQAARYMLLYAWPPDVLTR